MDGSALKKRAGPQANGEADQMEAQYTSTANGGAQRGAADKPGGGGPGGSSSWLFLPMVAILTTLLLSTLYVLRLEQTQVLQQGGTIKELKTQIKALRQEVLSARSIGQCSSGSVTKLQDEVHKLERMADGLRTGKQDAEKQLQEMISRVSLLQTERNKLKAALRAMKQELTDGEDEAQGSGSSAASRR